MDIKLETVDGDHIAWSRLAPRERPPRCVEWGTRHFYYGGALTGANASPQRYWLYKLADPEHLEDARVVDTREALPLPWWE